MRSYPIISLILFSLAMALWNFQILLSMEPAEQSCESQAFKFNSVQTYLLESIQILHDEYPDVIHLKKSLDELLRINYESPTKV